MKPARSRVHEIPAQPNEVMKQSSRLDTWFEEIPEAVAILGTDDRVIRINKEFSRMFGYEPDEVLERPINDLIVPDTQIESAREYMCQLKHGHRVDVETIRRRKDGTDFHVSILAVAFPASSGGQVAEICAMYRDITERKRAEERLLHMAGEERKAILESEVRFQAIADTAPVLIWTTGTDALCNYFSKPWLDFTGRTMEQEVGMGWTEGVHPDDLQGCFDGFLPAFHARKPFRMEYRLKRADGEYRWVDESGIPRYTPGGQFAGYIGCNIDITERKRAEEEHERLRQALADLARVNRVTTMGELTASLAHEVNQPIAAASTNANTCLRWLAGDTPNIEEAREAASRIVRDGKRAAEIISRIRQFFKKGTSEREFVDVNEIIREMTILLHGETARYDILVGTDLAADLPQVMADRVQLQQVLMNLMINGIEAMRDADGTHELTIRSKRMQNEEVVVSVTDSGVGLPRQQTEQIFNAFFTTKPYGTGMGLRISRSIVESHGGRLWAANNSSRGASFCFSLPTKAEAPK